MAYALGLGILRLVIVDSVTQSGFGLWKKVDLEETIRGGVSDGVYGVNCKD